MEHQQVIDTPISEQTVNKSDLIENNHHNDTESEIFQRSTRIRRSTISDDYVA